jgi:glycogen operon protein
MPNVLRVWAGRSSPLGATAEPCSVNFAIFSENATKVEFCLFDSPDLLVQCRKDKK